MRLNLISGLLPGAIAFLLATSPVVSEAAEQVTATEDRAAADSVKNGYYASLGNVKSADIEFHIRRGTQSKDLVLECTQTDEFGNDDAIAVHAPKLRIKHGGLSYNGPANISGPSFGDPVTSTSTLTLHLKHVNGPVIHYTYQGEPHTETTAWKGTTSSPACSTIGNHGTATLFGPVPGE